MTTIATARQLRLQWEQVRRQLEARPDLAFRFIEDPVATLRELGYKLGPPALAALRAAMP